ncbi:hypothetical protein GCM10009744_28900 [Kribbella alba]|uniref:PEGA domain-containing protein n=1 Tax=Kribbella alba TaxID=190197 RepID=A0ABP4R7T8_9ACTN
MDESQRSRVLGGAVVVVLVMVVVLGGFLVFRSKPSHMLTVRSIPNDLTLTLDGTAIAADGQVKVKEGRHTLVGQRRGFETYTQRIDLRGDSSVKVYLFSNSADGRSWERNHPDQVLETEADAARRYEEMNGRLQRTYPILQELPYVGPGFTVNYGASEALPDDPEQLAFYIKVTDSEGRRKSQEWLTGHGYATADLELIYTT